MTGQYVEILCSCGLDHVVISNGDIVHKGLDRTVFEGQWFFYRAESKFTVRLPKAKTYEEALEAYQQDTGNCIVGVA
jgi:uncharacterized membrane protein YbaN (DUF454 family)